MRDMLLSAHSPWSVNLTGERDADAIKDCQNIHDLANTNLASLAAYGITAGQTDRVAGGH